MLLPSAREQRLPSRNVRDNDCGSWRAPELCEGNNNTACTLHAHRYASMTNYFRIYFMLNYFYEYVGMFCHKLTQSAVSVVQQYSEK